MPFLDYFVRTPNFRERVNAKGTTNYAAIRPKDVLEYNIPLPPLSEQHRIVARIEELAAKIKQVRTLKYSNENKLQQMLLSTFNELITHAKFHPVKEVAPITRRPVEVDIDGKYLELGIRSFGRGTFHKPELTGLEVGSKRLYRIEIGDLVLRHISYDT